LADKIFPHNLRHLFARSFYEIDKDIAKLADVLGHSSINTTRIYMISTGEEHRRQLERLVTSGAVFDSEFWRRKYQGWEINDITPIQNDVTKEWSIYLKLRRTVPRRKSAVFAKLRKS
jgi:hypothetical protein